jgi:hypothetical protein
MEKGVASAVIGDSGTCVRAPTGQVAWSRDEVRQRESPREEIICCFIKQTFLICVYNYKSRV